ncbi:MAG: hypothetical protein ACRBK7_12555 [Acidimicrobiales bacterium]
MRSVRSLLLWFGVVALLLSACGSSSDDGEESEASETSAAAQTTATTAPQTTSESPPSESTTTTESSTTTESPATTVGETTTVVTSEAGLPATPVAAFLSQAYLFGSEQGLPTADQLPFPVNTVTAHWYQSDGFYVVVYGALDPSLVVCPGNSLQTASAFVNVSNAPMNGADCSFAPTVAEAPSGVVTCNRMVSYVTLIPAGTEGVLFGTIEMMSDGLGIGLTGQAPTDPANTPEIARELIDC